MQRTIVLIRGLVRRKNEGQDLLEYSILVALIAIVAIGAVTTLGNTIDQAFWQMIAQKF